MTLKGKMVGIQIEEEFSGKKWGCMPLIKALDKWMKFSNNKTNRQPRRILLLPSFMKIAFFNSRSTAFYLA